MKSLQNALSALRLKLFFEKLLSFGIYCFTAAFAVSGILIIISRFTYFPMVRYFCIAAFVLTLIVSLILALIKKPTFQDAAKTGDSLGCKERLQTAYEILSKTEKPSGMNALAVEDAKKTAESSNLSKAYKMRLPQYALYACIAFLAFSVISFYVPIPKFFTAQIEKRIELDEKLVKEIKKIEAVTTENKANLAPKQAEDVQKKLDELKKELKSAKNEGEAIKALQNAQESMKKIYNDTKPKELQMIGEKLSAHAVTKELSEALQTGDLNAVNKSIESVVNNLSSLSEEDLKKLAESINQAAQDIKDNAELRDSLNQLNQALESSNDAQITQSMKDMAAAYANAAAQSPEVKQALDNMSKAMSQSAQSMQGQSAQNMQNQSGQQGQSTQSSQPSQTGQPNSGGQPNPSAGPSQNGSSGQGSQSGQSGSGGQGSQSSQSGQSGSGGQGGSGRGSGHIEDEMIYSRGAVNKSSYDTKIEGAENPGGNTQIVETKGLGEKGETLPYSEVYNEYKDEALESLDDYNIPHGLQELIKEYFSTLE